MRNLAIYLGALGALSTASAYSHGAAQLRDQLAYPKYQVVFLNDLPVSISDAEKAKVRGIEREEEWESQRLESLDRRTLGDGTEGSASTAERLKLVPMSLAPPGSDEVADFLCLMPSRNSTESQIAQTSDGDLEELDPVQSWAALSHLENKCLYSKQGWFTYAYCHNSHIRQFREARQRNPHPPAGYIPEEDKSFDAYTLGQASDPSKQTPSDSHPNSKSKSKSTKQTSNDISGKTAVSFATSAASRYLVQRWSDGTACDKTNKPREVEVQVHCSMTSTDTLYLVKEMSICQYVVVIHSPHLCGLPGFRAPHADIQPANIQCRQIIPDDDLEAYVSGKFDGNRVKTLQLPFERPVESEDRIKPSSEEPADTTKDNTVADFELSDELQRTLKAALDAQSHADAVDETPAEDVVFLSIEADEEGNLVWDADVVDGEGVKAKMDDSDRELLLKVVKQYLEAKGQKGEEEKSDDAEERKRDEL